MSLAGSDRRSRFERGASRFAGRLVPLIYGVSALAFVADLQRDNTLAYGIIYTPLVATAVFHRRRSGLWILTALACLLVVIGAFLPVLGSDLPDVIGNRVLSIIAILSTAAFVHQARTVQDRLADQTQRAEAAERIKTDVLTNLSGEIRTPLHTLLGVLTLTTVTARPDQREALMRVQSDARRLLATIDNLIDLSQFDAGPPQLSRIDLLPVVQEAVTAAGPSARERQVVVTIAQPDLAASDGTAVLGEAWAVRRIMDNLLANAVRLTPPGGAVAVSLNPGGGMITVSVSDTGNGLPPEVTRDFGQDAPVTYGSALPENGGGGLALSSRLARAMNGRVTARNEPGSGATVSLSLPAARSAIV